MEFQIKDTDPHKPIYQITLNFSCSVSYITWKFLKFRKDTKHSFNMEFLCFTDESVSCVQPTEQPTVMNRKSDLRFSQRLV
jgi:hypothetical protein